MINKKNLIFFLIAVLLNNCSFDNKTGIWQGSAKEKKRISELEKKQKEITDIKNLSVVKTINQSVLISLAVYFKNVRLIDNIEVVV